MQRVHLLPQKRHARRLTCSVPARLSLAAWVTSVLASGQAAAALFPPQTGAAAVRHRRTAHRPALCRLRASAGVLSGRVPAWDTAGCGGLPPRHSPRCCFYLRGHFGRAGCRALRAFRTLYRRTARHARFYACAPAFAPPKPPSPWGDLAQARAGAHTVNEQISCTLIVLYATFPSRVVAG